MLKNNRFFESFETNDFSATKFKGFGELVFKKENHFRGKKKLFTKLKKKRKERLNLENISSI